MHEVAELPPIAVFWGDRDENIPFAHGRAFAESFEGVAFVPFEGCGHYLHREKPEAFARALRDFLDAPSVPAARLRAAGAAQAEQPGQGPADASR